MSATNHTSNYNLPQFIGTDKPTWLTDVNGAFSAIDSQMKTNADNISTASSTATSASTAVGTLANLNTTDKTSCVNAINEVNTDLGTTKGVVTSQGLAISTNASDISTINSKLTLSDIDTVDTTTIWSGISGDGSLTLAQSADGSVFKLYGSVYLNNDTSSTITKNLTAIAGLSGKYGVATGLFLNSAHTSAYTVTPCGIESRKDKNSGYINTIYDSTFVVGTDNQIYIYNSSSASKSYGGKTETRLFFTPCIYFDSDFGDNPNE